MSKAKAFAFLVAALIYLILPTDLLPDFIQLVGYVDDALLMLAAAWVFYRKWKAKPARALPPPAPTGPRTRQGPAEGRTTPPPDPPKKD